MATDELGGRWKSIRDVFKANPQFTITLIAFISLIAAIFIFSAIFPFTGYQYTYSFQLPNGKMVQLPLLSAPPSWDHLLGTTHDGYDNLITLINGARNSILVGLGASGIAVPIAIVVGVFGAYKGGVIDNILSQVTNVILVFPVIALYMLIAATIGRQSVIFVTIIIGAVTWPWAARSIRSQVLSLKERDFVNLARVTGEKGWKIAITEILPNMLSYVILVVAIEMVIAITTEAALAMIGVGQTDIITLGRMLQWSLQWTEVPNDYYWLWLPPGIVVLILLIMIYVLQGSMPQIFNPRLREK